MWLCDYIPILYRNMNKREMEENTEEKKNVEEGARTLFCKGATVQCKKVPIFILYTSMNHVRLHILLFLNNHEYNMPN